MGKVKCMGKWDVNEREIKGDLIMSERGKNGIGGKK
jgi:hypothetical protein